MESSPLLPHPHPQISFENMVRDDKFKIEHKMFKLSITNFPAMNAINYYSGFFFFNIIWNFLVRSSYISFISYGWI